MNISTFALYYFIFINIFSFFIYLYDKVKAIKNRQRVSEKSLHILSVIGGFIGSLLSMMIFRHKIKKIKFMVVYMIIMATWIAIIAMRVLYV